MILSAILQEAEHGFELTHAAREFVQFVAWFGIFGPLGFRWAVLRGGLGSRGEPERELSAVDAIGERALRSAALIGLGGALLLIADLLPWNARNGVAVVCAALLALAYAVARRGVGGAWLLALLIGLVLVFRSIVTLRWATLVNPIHMTAAALWIGTLFVLVASGLPAVLRAPLQERRGPLVADLIARFSPVALVSAGILVLSGVTTAWRNLGGLSELWSSSYGWTLIVKLCFVAVVVALGAWNWRRMSPRLGTEEAAHSIRRSATAEVSFTIIVLIVTSVLVSLPSPAERRERRPPRTAGPATAPALVPAGAEGAAGGIGSPPRGRNP